MGNILFGKPLPHPVPLEASGYAVPMRLRKVSPETARELQDLERSRADTWRKLRSGELDRMMGWG